MLLISWRPVCNALLLSMILGCGEVDRPLGDHRNNMADSGNGSDATVATGGTNATGGGGATGGTGATAGTGGSARDGGSRACFSPTQNPELALLGGEGCECSGDDAFCVFVVGSPRLVALHCGLDGRWHSVEDGVCEPLARGEQYPACKIGHVIYPNGATGVPDPFSCNTCNCVDGTLGLCTQAHCPLSCPPNTVATERCFQCGPNDTCEIVEHACLPTSCVAGGAIACPTEECTCDPSAEWYRSYVTTDASQCALIDYSCPGNTIPFSNDCGCGCEQDVTCPRWFFCNDASMCVVETLRQRCPYTRIAG